MMLFKNKYRIESARLKGWDYSSPGAYFVTIITKNRACYFGNVKNGFMCLNELGEIAKQCFEKIPEHFPFVSPDVFVIMPNHVHGIIIINDKNGNKTSVGVQNIVETQDVASLRSSKNKFGPQSKNLASIVRGYKIGVTKYARENNIPFQWQSRYYDHIIRDEKSLNNIRRYIINNPLNWQKDAENSRTQTNQL